MNSVSPGTSQYGSPEALRRAMGHRNLSGHADQNRTGSEAAARDGDTDEVEKIKSKLLTAWHSVKYGWAVKTKTSFSTSSPLYLLGQHYDLSFHDDIERFQKDFISRVWMTYRKDFPALEGTVFTTDCGWGCMIRSAQMLLAQGLLVHLLSRGWFWPDASYIHLVDVEPIRSSSPSNTLLFSVPSSTKYPQERAHSTRNALPHRRCVHDPHQEQMHRDILRWLSDHPEAPFGLHHMVHFGGSLGKKAGDWYGPSIVAHILRKALEKNSKVPELSVYVSQDCTVYRGDVEHLLGEDPPSGTSSVGKAVIILVPVRLGGETFNPVYKHCVKEFLQMPSCLGIIGGKPKHSLYFIGFQDSYLLYLDPHYCQPYVDTSKEDFPLESFHCNHPRKMPITRMDPSCTFAFYARHRKEFDLLCNHLAKALNSTSAEEKYPVFSISAGKAQEYSGAEGMHYAPHPPQSRTARRKMMRPNSDEFEFL
uniref:Cysteine protease n=1 Tax=Leptobrachium leishanense TaxID=445787 RepID=A0A8C5M4G7_9ANUR